MPIAKKATMNDEELRVKILVWGEPGSGKSRFSLSAPAPLVVDLEGSTRLYAKEFDFYRADVDATIPEAASPLRLIATLLEEFKAGEYKDRRTLVIDPITDLLDAIEKQSAASWEQANGKKIGELNALEKTKWYAYRRERARGMLDQIKGLPLNVIWVARSKSVWGKDENGKTSPIGATYDALDIVEYLCDVVIQLEKVEQGKYRALVKKSRLANLPDVLDVKNWTSIEMAIKDAKTKIDPSAEKTTTAKAGK